MPLFLQISHIISDFLFILLSFTVAYFLRVGMILSTDFPFSVYAGVFIPTALIWSALLIFQRIYKDAVISKRRLFTNIISANLIGVTIFVLIFFFNRDVFFSRLVLAYVWGISNILLIANAWAFRLIKFHTYKKGIGTKKTLIVGANKVAESMIANFQSIEPFYQPVAILDSYGTKKKEILGVPVLGKMNSLEDVIKEYNIQAIAQADCIEQSVNLVQICEKNKLDYFLSPSLFGAYHANISSEFLGKLPFVSLRSK